MQYHDQVQIEYVDALLLNEEDSPEDEAADSERMVVIEATGNAPAHQPYHIKDLNTGEWVDSRRVLMMISANETKTYHRNDRLERVKGMSRTSTFSAGFAAAAPDDEGKEQSFGLGSCISMTFNEAGTGGSYCYYIGKILRIVLKQPGSPKPIRGRVELSKITEDMYLSVSWLKPVLENGQSVLDATHYELGPPSENNAFYQAKYVINVVNVESAQVSDTPQLVFNISRDQITNIKEYVLAAQETDSDIGVNGKKTRKRRPREETQRTDDAGSADKVICQTRSGRVGAFRKSK